MSTRTRTCQPFRFFPSAALGFLAVALISTGAHAQSVARPDLSRIKGTAIQGTPLSQRTHTVVLKMAGDSVAVVRSRMPNKQLAEADRLAIQTDLRRQQDAIVPAIEGMGGKVLARFQHAINGIKVQGTPDQIKLFAGLPGVLQVKEVRTYSLSNAHSVPFIGAPSVWQTPP